MDPTALARSQFAITTIYHFFFVPLTLGLSILVAIMETMYVRTGQEKYKAMTKFWGKLFLVNFAMGVVTGLVQEFQFGMNWSEYSRFVGDVFGAPLAIEGLSAFFLESTFLGIWIFGWDKLSKKTHAAVMWLVALGGNLSAMWILVANSFMHHPVGYVLGDGRAEMVDFFALVSNPFFLRQFPHVLFAGLTTAAFFVMGISAYHLIKKNHEALFIRSFQIGAIAGVIGAVMVGLVGHSQTQHLIEAQPMKLAAAEALWETESPASFSLISIPDAAQRKDIFSIRIPYALCLLAYNRLDCTVEGINDLQAQYEQQYGPGNYIPPVGIAYWTFRIMVGVGTLMLLVALYAYWMTRRGKFDIHPLVKPLFVWGIALPYLGTTSGWLITEMGRFPWVVYGLMKIEDAASPNVGAGSLWFSMLGFTLVYGVLMVADVYLLRKFAMAGPQSEDKASPSKADGYPSLVGAQDQG